MYPAAALMEVVEAHQIRLEAVMDAIDMKTFGLMAAIGKIELDNFRERSTMGKRGAAKQGRMPVGRLPYGYRSPVPSMGADHDQLVPVRSVVTERAFVAQGLSPCHPTNRVRSSSTNLSTGTRCCCMVSRSRMVTAWSSRVSKSTVTQRGVPISSWRR